MGMTIETRRGAAEHRVARRGLLAITLVVLPVASPGALASDLAPPRQPIYTKAPSPAEVGYDWSGFYAGVHLGYETGRARVVDNGVLRESAAPMDGVAAGVLAGYNWQAGRVVYGLEGDLSASSLQGHGTAATPIVVPNEYDVNVSGNIRGRIGYAVLPHTLIYGAGGLSLAEFKLRDGNAPGLNSAVLTGWTAGAGIDQAIAPNLIGRVEYLYSDYGRKDITIAPGDVYNVGFKAQTVRAALIAQLEPDSLSPAAKAYAMAEAPANWSGFYLGGDVGAAMESGNTVSNFFQNNTPPLDNNRQGVALHGTNVVAGVHAGYNWQFSPNWIMGIEGDWQWIGAKTSFCRQTDTNSLACSDNGFGFASMTAETRSIGSLRGRVGYAVDRVLVYGTGGVAVGDLRTSISLDCRRDGCGESPVRLADSTASSVINIGWVAGAGIETMLDHNWIVRTEYLHFDLGSVAATLPPTANCASCGGLSWSRSVRDDLVRASLSYKIGG